MLKLMVVMSIGCSHEAQLRATKILDFVSDTYQLVHDHHDHHKTNYNPTVIPASEGLFEFGHRILAERWRKLRTVVQRSRTFGIQHFFPCHCNFLGNISHPNPAFAWMESKTDEDAAKLLSKLKIQVRTGTRFGFNISAKYVRVNMLGSDHTFNLFLERVSALGEH